MKNNNLLFFLLGVILAISVAATTTDLMTIKPAQPTSTVVEFEYSEGGVKAFISKYSAQGYQVHAIAGEKDGTYVVMVKY